MTLITKNKGFYFVISLLTATITACRQMPFYNHLPPALPQERLLQVYFNHSPSSEYEDPYRHNTRPGDNLEQKIIDTISRAQVTVDVAIQELRLPKIAQALAEKHKAGIRVRVIVENNPGAV